MAKCKDNLFKLEECITTAVQEVYETSANCASCFGQDVNCSLQACMIVCTSEDKKKCIACYENSCWSKFKNCAGMPPSEPIPQGILDMLKLGHVQKGA